MKEGESTTHPIEEEKTITSDESKAQQPKVY